MVNALVSWTNSLPELNHSPRDRWCKFAVYWARINNVLIPVYGTLKLLVSVFDCFLCSSWGMRGGAEFVYDSRTHCPSNMFLFFAVPWARKRVSVKLTRRRLSLSVELKPTLQSHSTRDIWIILFNSTSSLGEGQSCLFFPSLARA